MKVSAAGGGTQTFAAVLGGSADFAIGDAAPERYMLLGQIAESRCTQMVNPKYTYICKVNKSILSGYFG